MITKFVSVSLSALALLTFCASASAQSTTRIETRPFYGATVTLEEGVRVIRPLPPERHVIINPDGATPLTLNFNQTRVYDNRVIQNYYRGGGATERSRRRVGYFVPRFYSGKSSLGGYGARHFGARHHGHHRGGHR